MTLPEQAPRPPAQVAPEGDDRRTAATDLLIISFSLLFLEQACIRWLASNLRLLQCTANFTLLACFLGMGLGMLRARSRSLLGLTLPLLLIGCLAMSSLDLGIVLNSVGLGSSQVVASRSTLFAPLWVILSVIFVFVAVLFVGPGQAIGNLFGRLAPLEAYSWNVGGSILGILVFMGFSAFSLAPAWWFVVGGCCVLWLLRNSRIPLMISAVSLIAAVVLIARLESDAIWSPYNRITLAERTVQGNRILGLFVNRISFQVLLPLNSPGGHFYDFPYLFNRMGRGRSEPGRFLVIGAGTGNDVSHILAAGASHVDAVEIDPAILKIGRERHPERPYADPRVKAWVDDGRGFLRRSTDKYDFIVYALVDSMSILSQFGTVRLENYLFTEDAIRDVKNHLAPDGIFAMYNYYGHGWLVARIYRVMQKVFGEENVVMMSFPPRAVYDEDTTDTAFVAFFAGDVKKIRALLDGGQMQIKVSAWERDGKDELVPLVATREVRGAPALIPTDDWPFIYLRQHAIPEETWLSVGVIAGVSVIMLFGLGGVRPRHIRPHFFFLGAAFMLIETDGIARLPLLFGSTWINNSLAFLGILTLALIANFIAAKWTGLAHRDVYIGLFISLALAYVVPLDALLGLPFALRGFLGLLLLFLPVFFSGLVFARSFRESPHPDQDLGANLLGAVAGGCLENLSILLGYHGLLWLIAAVYALSLVGLRRTIAAGSPS